MTMTLDTNTLLDDERALIRSYVEAALNEDIDLPDGLPLYSWTGFERVKAVLTSLVDRLKEDREYEIKGWELFAATRGIEIGGPAIHADTWAEWEALDRVDRIKYGRTLESLRTRR